MKIVIIKLGAKGDVIRTLLLAKALKEKYSDSKIYWITKENVKDLLSDFPFIDTLIAIPANTEEEFNALYNFDIDDVATELANKIKAKKKYGFYKQDSFISAFNLGAEYYLNTLFDDEIKKTNKKTYQEMMFDAAEIPFKKENVGISLKKEDLDYAKNFFLTNKINPDKLIGIHMGASPRWPSKAWHTDNIEDFIIKAQKIGYQILLFGGPEEIKLQENFVIKLRKKGIKVFQNNPKNADREFASLVNSCKAMICSDSFALHVSIALRKPTIGLFFCTSPSEVEGYNILTKLVSPMLKDFFPEKMDEYSEELIKSIKAEEVLSALENSK